MRQCLHVPVIKVPVDQPLAVYFWGSFITGPPQLTSWTSWTKHFEHKHDYVLAIILVPSYAFLEKNVAFLDPELHGQNVSHVEVIFPSSPGSSFTRPSSISYQSSTTVFSPKKNNRNAQRPWLSQRGAVELPKCEVPQKCLKMVKTWKTCSFFLCEILSPFPAKFYHKSPASISTPGVSPGIHWPCGWRFSGERGPEVTGEFSSSGHYDPKPGNHQILT